MKLRTLYLIIVIFLMGIIPTAAQDDPLPPIPCCGVFTDPAWLRIDYHRVNTTIENQIAETNVDMQFTNEGEALAEGTFIFPLPEGAAVDQLVMYVNGQAIEARILPAGEAREIYNEIVRQYRDPALLEYIGSSLIQANVFPIPPGESRRIEINYSQILEVDNGLIHYIYPVSTNTLSSRPVDQMSISVDVVSNDPISNIYSPSHNIAINRLSETEFRAGWEAVNVSSTDDFSLYYGIASNTINVNLLSYKDSSNEDGFFMLLVQPPVSVPDDQIIPKDVIIVLDQSGSMAGSKWDQARAAAVYVLDHLGAQDRFNVVLFSTGVRTYSDAMQSRDTVEDASNWINSQYAEGGTDINAALLTALDLADTDRPTTILFLTDGLATEGVVWTDDIMANLEMAAKPNVRIFTFGVGDDVDTFLLDRITTSFHGVSSYVRPSERIDEEVASLYNKISAPVLTNVLLEVVGSRVEMLYPQQLNDLFAGEQITVVGRYRDPSDDVTIKLSGIINGVEQIFTYDGLELRANAGGEAFIPRLWATRRIGDLLNTIRLNGENQELIDSIISLSVRYGIITPYTSFLIEEDDILTQQGQAEARMDLADEAAALNSANTGQGAVDAADNINSMSSASVPLPSPTSAAFAPSAQPSEAESDMEMPGGGESFNALTNVNDRTFVNIDGVWYDTTFDADNMTTTQVVFLSDEYFDLLEEFPELADYFALGDHVIVVLNGIAYEVVPE
ncbi:MAG: VWA domain-containing protein [Chloroflexi bacterium]|nr:MAG: VWA domain-containing protein [Chloroflexota bacterium]